MCAVWKYTFNIIASFIKFGNIVCTIDVLVSVILKLFCVLFLKFLLVEVLELFA